MIPMLANQVAVLAVFIAAGFFALFVFSLVYVERRIDKHVKAGRRIHLHG